MYCSHQPLGASFAPTLLASIDPTRFTYLGFFRWLNHEIISFILRASGGVCSHIVVDCVVLQVEWEEGVYVYPCPRESIVCMASAFLNLSFWFDWSLMRLLSFVQTIRRIQSKCWLNSISNSIIQAQWTFDLPASRPDCSLILPQSFRQFERFSLSFYQGPLCWISADQISAYPERAISPPKRIPGPKWWIRWERWVERCGSSLVSSLCEQRAQRAGEESMASNWCVIYCQLVTMVNWEWIIEAHTVPPSICSSYPLIVGDQDWNLWIV